MSTPFTHALVHRSRSRKRAIGVATAMLVSVLAIPSSPVSANYGPEKLVVREGESIQAAIDAAEPGTKIVVRGDHTENIWINKSGIELVGRAATLTPPGPGDRALNPCSGGDENGPIADLATTICVHPLPFDGFPPPPEAYLDGVTIRGFHLPDAVFDAIGVYFTNNVHIERNTALNPGCDGIFVLFATHYEITRNIANGSQFCSGIDVPASSHGTISRNTTVDNDQNGIVVNDNSHVTIHRNTASGSCFGINVGNPPDFLDLPSEDVTVTRNTTSANNSVCLPFGPDFPVGVTGILAVGIAGITIERNTANDNVSEEFSISAGGIFVGDFPGETPDDPPNLSSDVNVSHNTAKGNSSAAGPVDVAVTTLGGPIDVHRNRCDVAISAAGPEPTWCRP